MGVTHVVMEILRGGVLDAAEQVTAYHRYNPLLAFDLLPPHHCVGLASTRLAVSKDADIVPETEFVIGNVNRFYARLAVNCSLPVEGMLQHLLSNVSVHHRLGGEFWIVGL